MNKCIFSARATRDVELRYTQGNTAVASVGIAVDTGYGENKKANFFNCTAWGKTAEVMEKHVKKGTKLFLECEANQNTYEKDGKKISAVDFKILNFEFAESKSATQQEQPAASPYGKASGDGFMNYDNIPEDLPFN